MRKPSGHKEKYSNKCEILQSHSNDGTAARTRPFSFDEIMLRRKSKKQSGSVEDQRAVSVVVSSRVESDRHRHNDRDVGGSEQHVSKEPLKVSSRTKEDKSKVREDKIVEDEYQESNIVRRKSIISSDFVNDRRKERGVHEKRKNHDRLSDDSDNEHRKRHGKDSAVKERDRNVEKNRGKSEHISKRTQNGYEEKKHESRKWHDAGTSERKEQKGTSDSYPEDSKLRRKRSRSREHVKDKSKRSNSPSPMGHKQRLYDAREHDRDKGKNSNLPSPRGHKQRLYDVPEHEELTSRSSKDKLGKSDSNVDKKLSNNGSSNKSKRHDTSASRLGGYSPRKRRSEVAVRTPSPTSRSPEKKKVGWDSPPVKIESKISSFLPSDLSSVNKKTELSNKHEVSSVVPNPPSIPNPTFGVLSSIPSLMNTSVDSVQLTQATRPKRRIYVENLPSSASETAVMKWLSGYLRPYGVNHVQGTSPCISCIVNKEKGQALVEFLTPEDASTALTFDGKSFSGNILKIRRPKDYVESTTGVSEKPVAGAVSVFVRDIVEDSPNKLFIGGISKVITSEMLMGIASAFGPLKAYHFENNADLDSPCAFIEYADQSVTVKACVGLNGMKLGGQVLTVTQATPDASSMENHGDKPFYGTPAHAQPLLEKPTQVLKLNNLLDPHNLSSLSESDLEEILEDVRLECARFGKVKSINIIKQTHIPTHSETVKVAKEGDSIMDEATDEPADENKCHDDDDDAAAAANGIVSNNNKHENEIVKNETYDTTMVDKDKSNQLSSAINQLELNDNKPTDDIETVSSEPISVVKAESDDTTKANDDSSDLNDGFEVGCVLVEYKRVEASSMAAHCLHARVFDGRNVSVQYVPYHVYCNRFYK